MTALLTSQLRKNDLAANHGHLAARLENFRLGNFHDVVRENGEIGQLADFDRTFVLLFERGVGGPER